MSPRRTVGQILRDHTTLEAQSIDRMYLNVYVPGLQYESGVAAFFRSHRGQLFASSALMAPMSRAFVTAIDTFVTRFKAIQARHGNIHDDHVGLNSLRKSNGFLAVLGLAAKFPL